MSDAGAVPLGDPVGDLVRLREALVRRRRPVTAFAVLDAARGPDVLATARRTAERVECLYRAALEREAGDVAPHLAEFDLDGPGVRELAAEARGEGWGIFALSGAGFDGLMNHLRRYLLVDLPDGRDGYFRFYDPRILRAFLPLCRLSESQAFFGPIEVLVAESDEGASRAFLAPRGRDGKAGRGRRLTLRPEMMAAFAAVSARRFRREAVERLAARWPGVVGLEGRFDAALERAARWGLASDTDLFVFADLDCALGAGFEETETHAWARKVLASSTLSSTLKREALLDGARRRGVDLGSRAAS